MQRRTLMIAGAALTSVAFMPAALAADGLPYDAKGDPFAFVVDLSNAVLDRIRSSEALKSGNVDSLRKLVDEIVLPATDFTMMTRMTVGPKWRTATAEQKKALESGFETLLLRVYAGGLTAVKDQKCELRPTRVKKAQPEMVIRTLLKSSGAEPIALDYRIYRAKDDTWKIVDVNIEGIWMVENYRAQFSSVLSQDGVEGLIKLFNEKGEELARQVKNSGGKA